VILGAVDFRSLLAPAELLIAPYSLTWAEVDPVRHPFEAADAPAVVRGLAPAMEVPGRPEGRAADPAIIRWSHETGTRWAKAMSAALVERYGRWACGWRWAMAEGDIGGGPIGAWCCPRDSMSTPDATLGVVAASLVEWRSWLEDLNERFARFLPLPPGAGDDAVLDIWERAVAQLVTVVVDRTGAESGWHGHCGQVLGWFLTAAGVPAEQHKALIGDAIGGRFHSWVRPSGMEIADVADRMAHLVVGQPAARPGQRADDWPDTWPEGWPSRRAMKLSGPAPARSQRLGAPREDDLSRWLAVRAEVDWSSAAAPVSDPVRGDRDGIADYAAERESDGRELSTALEQVRQAATDGAPLTFARLAQWQRTVLGVPEAGFRTGPASAKAGRESYHWRADLPERFEACLSEATDGDVPLPSRAARVYLDVAFFHPFDDGNARAAALALYYILARDGVILDRAEPLLMTVRRAHDTLGAAGLARLIEMLVNATRRRAQQ